MRKDKHSPAFHHPPGAHHNPQRRRAVGELLFHAPKKRKVAGWLAVAVLTLGALLLAILWWSDHSLSDLPELVNWSGLTEAIAGLNPVLVIPLIAILPIFGFPVSVTYLVAGARFGAIGGGLVVALATAVHLLGSWAIARSFLRQPLQRFIARRHRHLPEIPADEQAMVALVVALVPGLPYVVRIYLVALADMRLRIYFWVSLIVYTLRSYVTILLGDLSSEPSGRRLVILLAVDAFKIVICALVIWWLRVHHRRYHGHPGDASVPPTGAAT